MITSYKNTRVNIKEPGKLSKEENNVEPGSARSKVLAINKVRKMERLPTIRKV